METFKRIRFLHGYCDKRKIENILSGINSDMVISDFPLLDVVERDDKLIVFAELPGLDVSDFTIYQIEEFLIIEGIRKKEADASDVVYIRMERQAFNFRRVLYIGYLNKLALLKAILKDGVLTLEFKKDNLENIIEITED